MPKGQRICKVFGVEWRETSFSPWKCGRFGPLVRSWHSETSVSIYASRKAILPPKNYAVNFTFISWHFHWYKVSFLFLRALTPGSIKSCKEIRSNPKSHVPNSQESCMYTLPNSQQPPPHLINYIESELHTHKQQLHIFVQCFFWCKTSLHLQGFQCMCRLAMNFFFIYSHTRWLKFKLRKHQKRHKTIRCNMYFSGSVKNCKEIQSEKPCTEFPGKLHSYSSK